jgi:hypothetical protein
MDTFRRPSADSGVGTALSAPTRAPVTDFWQTSVSTPLSVHLCQYTSVSTPLSAPTRPCH